MRGNVRNVVVSVLMILCLALANREADQLTELRRKNQIGMTTSLDLSEFIGALTMGGLRSIMIDVLWMRAIRLGQEKKHFELFALYTFISKLQPRFPNVWTHNSWNMGWNIPATVREIIGDEKESFEECYRWIREATEFLKIGLSKNPGNAKICFELAWTYYDRSTTRVYEYTDAGGVTRQYVRERFIEDLGGRDPLLEALHWFKMAERHEDLETLTDVYKTQQMTVLDSLRDEAAKKKTGERLAGRRRQALQYQQQEDDYAEQIMRTIKRIEPRLIFPGTTKDHMKRIKSKYRPIYDTYSLFRILAVLAHKDRQITAPERKFLLDFAIERGRGAGWAETIIAEAKNQDIFDMSDDLERLAELADQFEGFVRLLKLDGLTEGERAALLEIARVQNIPADRLAAALK